MSTNPNYIAMRDWLEEHEPTPDDLIELIQAERERCAKIAHNLAYGSGTADAIRGGEHDPDE